LQLAEPVCRSGIAVVDEYYVMANEHPIADRDALANKRVARNLAVSADVYTLLYFDKGANLCVIADFAAVEINKAVNLNTFAQLNVRRDFLKSRWRSFRRVG
jgi:hypothetical protein